MAVIIHIPHASGFIPQEERWKFSISDDDLRRELLLMTDHYTDQVFDVGQMAADSLVFPVSRLVVDPERFAEDAAEPMANRGMGAIYTRTSDGRPLRPCPDAAERQRLLESYYFPHHEALGSLVEAALGRTGRSLIIDAHSFPSSPLPCDLDQTPLRPDICIGTDPFHTPEPLARMAAETFRQLGWTVELNRPYAGTIVPARFHRKDARVHSIMVEISPALYMDEHTGERSADFDALCARIRSALAAAIASVS
jgi:N-formylglutamate amidohydrolase